MRPDVGTQAQFKKKKAPATYRYDSSLAPEMQWDGQNSAREQAEALIAKIHSLAGSLASQSVLAGSLANRSVLAGSLANRSPETENRDDDRGAHRLASKPANTSEPADADQTIAAIQDAAEQLKALSRPFLNWSGKAERTSFDVPTLPLFVHERLSTKAIIETLTGHRLASKPANEQSMLFDLYGDPQHTIADQVLKAYEYQDNWTNRMILGDSLVVMNSLLHYENLGGQVQMIYIDPPYGVKFGSNFQPFVRKRDVKHGDDEDMSREPEMVQAYRDTWELGLHSYLTYMRDRLLLARELLTPSGSIFVQISDENLHHVKELMDEVFGSDNACAAILMRKSGWASTTLLPQVHDFILWYSRDIARVKYHQLFLDKQFSEVGDVQGAMVESPDGLKCRPLTSEERDNPGTIPSGWKLFFHDNLTSTGHSSNSSGPFRFNGTEYWPGSR
jgi:adenine-specific DNA-methyltransferase